MASESAGLAITLLGVVMITVGVVVSALTDFDLYAGVGIGIGFCLAVAGSRGFLARLLRLEPEPADERDESKAP